MSLRWKNGHDRPACPNINSNQDDDYESTSKEKKKLCENAARKKENKNKPVQFAQDMDNKASDKDNHALAQFESIMLETAMNQI